MASFELLLITDSAATETAVREALHGETAWQVRPHAAGPSGIGDLLRSSGATVALIDLGGDPRGGLSRLEPVLAGSKAPCVVLCDDLQTDDVLLAMQIGVRHCLVRRNVAGELKSTLRRLTRDMAPATEESSGELVTVLSARGGCGATTITVNLAEELRLQSQDDVLMVDLDCCFGAVATYLGIESQFGIMDLLNHWGEIDNNLVRSTSSPAGDMLHLLASPASVHFADPASVPVDNIETVLAACRRAFRTTVVDAPRVSMDVAATLARASSHVLIVFQLAVVDVRNARQIVTALTDRHVAHERILPVINRFHKRDTMVSLQDAQRALGDFPIAQVPNDFPNAVRSMNLGKPLAEVAPRSAIRKGLRELARDVGLQNTNGLPLGR